MDCSGNWNAADSVVVADVAEKTGEKDHFDNWVPNLSEIA